MPWSCIPRPYFSRTTTRRVTSSPSNSDIEMTGRIQKALKTIDVTLHDHLIVTAHDALSFKARGLL